MNQMNTQISVKIAALMLCLFVAIPINSVVFARDPKSGSSKNLNVTVGFSEPALQEIHVKGQSFTKIVVPGTLSLGKAAGEPSLPVSFYKILLPPLTTVASIRVTGPSVSLNSNIDLLQAPIMPYQTEMAIGSLPPTQLDYDHSLYESGSFYPEAPYDGSYQVGYCRGYSILSLAVFPVQYCPRDGMLLFHPTLSISVSLKETYTQHGFLRASSLDAAWVQRLVLNPEGIGEYQAILPSPLEYPGGLCDPSESHQYVIITTTQNDLDYWDTSEEIPNNWNTLMDEHAGLSPIVVTKQDIDACQDYLNDTPLFNDIQAHVREFCKDAYEDWGTEYVLIAGDGEWIPARDMDYSYESDVDADIYYSNLDNTFNSDQDSQWGEDNGFDLYSELYVGRLTCDTPQDVSNWMTKSCYYAAENNESVLDNAAFYAGDEGTNMGQIQVEFSAINGTSDWLGPDPDAYGPYPEWLGFLYGFRTWNEVHPSQPFNLSQMWTAESNLNPGWHGGSQAAAIEGLRLAINNNQVSLLSGVAHADPYMSLDVYDTDWETLYANDKPFFIYDYGCHCGDFDGSDDGILDSMLFRSNTSLAFACIFNSGYGWEGFYTTNSSSGLLQKLFWDYLLDIANNSGSPTNWQLGKAQAFAKDAMAPTINWTYGSAPDSWRGTIEGCNLFADPAQLLKPPIDHQGPQIPPTPWGPSEGIVGVWYNFTIESTEDNVYYRFDWGDGSDDIWRGPYLSGQNVTASHMWTSEGVFNIRVQAKDFVGALSNWSDPWPITIRAPVLSLESVKGGLGLKIILKSTVVDAFNIDWQATIEGGLFKRVQRQSQGSIDSLAVNTTISVRPFLLKPVIGLGRVSIHFTAQPKYAAVLTVDATGLLVGPFYILVTQ